MATDLPKGYRPSEQEPFMNERQREYFRRKLLSWKNDILREALPNNVVALTVVSRAPSWLLAVGLKPMSLGLDLRGGVHFLYQVDLNAAINQYMQTYESDLRQQFRQANIRNDIRVADGARKHHDMRRFDRECDLGQSLPPV